MQFSLVAFVATLAVASAQLIPRNVVGILGVENGNDIGRWEVNEFCPHGTYAKGFDLKVEEYQGLFGDDTSLNGMRLTCEPRNPTGYHGVIEAYDGEWGTWRGYISCANEDQFLNSFQARVQDPSLVDDNTGVNNVNFGCRYFEFDVEEDILNGNGRNDGKWGDWSNQCPLNSAICGFETQYHGPDVTGNSAVNDMIFYCCDD